MMYFLGWLINLFNPFPTDEYCERFLYPALRRGHDLGIPDDELIAMWSWSWDNAEPTSVGLAPVALFHRMMDEWEVAKHASE